MVVPKGLIWKLQGVTHVDEAEDARRQTESLAMRAVARIEKSLGFDPKDVTRDCCGYDILSHIPTSMRTGNAWRYIEVKGHSKTSTSVTLTKNEILFALGNPDTFILALVEVDGNVTRTTYLKDIPLRKPAFSEVDATHDIRLLVEGSQVLLQKEETWQ